MNSEDLLKAKIKIEEEHYRKAFGKTRVPRKPLPPKKKKSKRKMTQASRRKNRG